MNKEEIITEIKKLNLKKEDYWVAGSASLVLRNILSLANDIDLVFTKKCFDEFTKEHSIKYLGRNHNYAWYQINDKIEFCVDEKEEKKVEELEPFNLLNLEYYYHHLLKDSDREKDQEKKLLVEKALKEGGFYE